MSARLKRVWSGGPDGSPVTVDVDSTICEVSADTKHGASYGYTKQLGYHPLVAVRSETGEILHSRLRGGSSQKGAAHFVVEAVNRVRRGRCRRSADGTGRFWVLVLSSDS